MRLAVFAVIGVLASAPESRAEFLLTATPSSQTTPEAGRMGTPYYPKHAHRTGVVSAQGKRETPNAEGFGVAVPLDFAVKQIVPKTWSAKYGPDVDRGVTVDWVGGKPWNVVLAEAVKPKGLKVATIGPTTVEIQK